MVRRHSAVLYRIAYRSVRRPQEAEDLTQEIFMKVARTLDRYDESCAFRPWLLQVGRNHVIDHHRSRRRELASTIELDALPVEPMSVPARQADHVLRLERAEAIRRGLDELPETLREAVVLRDIDDLDYGEIAEVLGIPLGTVKSRINRGRVQLARELAPLRGDLT